MEKIREYFAFISYQRKDESMAKKLQHTLEYYKLPIAVIEKEPALKDGVRPVFVDMTELGDEPFLKPAIEKALKGSRFLIVICSPRSAKSKWVNKEIEYFISLKRTRRIIPFIIEGSPYATDENIMCCTPLLKNLFKERELLGININEMGFDAAAVKVVSRMFRVKFSILWNRYEKEKEEARRKLKEQNDRLLAAQSRFVAEKAVKLTEEGNAYTAQRITVEVLPKKLRNQNRPYTIEAESALRNASYHNTAILTGHTKEINSIDFSPNGEYLVSASNDNTAIVWQVKTGGIKCIINGKHSHISSAVFSPDNKHIAVVSSKYIDIWNIETNQVINTLKGHTWSISSVDYSPDGKHIVSASGSHDDPPRIWDVESGLVIRVLKRRTTCVESAAFSPNGELVALSYGDSIVRIYNIISGRMIGSCKGHTSSMVTCVSFSPDGSSIVSASYDNTVRIWNTTGKQLKCLEGHSDWVDSANFSPDGKYIISASADNKVIVWNAETGQLVRTIDGHKKAIFSPDGKFIASIINGFAVRLWDVELGKVVFIHEETSNFLKLISISPDEKYIASVSNNNTIKIWDNEIGYTSLVLTDHVQDITSLKFSPDGKRIISASGDSFSDESILIIHDTKTGEIIQSFKGHVDKVNSIAYSRCGRYLASASGDSFGLIISSNDFTIRIWDIISGKEIHVLRGHNSIINSVDFSPDNKYIVSASGDEFEDNSIRIWEVNSGKQIQTLRGHTKKVNSVVFSPDGRRIASSSDDYTIKVWDTFTGMLISTIKAHTKPVISVAFSPSGGLIVSTSWDQTVRVFDWKTGMETVNFNGHSSGVSSAFFCFDKKRIISASYDGTVRIWDYLPLQKLINQTREHFKDHPLTPEERRQYYLD